MDSASTDDDRLREIVDRLLASPGISAGDRLFLEEAKGILSAPAPHTITIRHEPRTVPEPAITSLRMPGGDR
jgi:hypothetical protein